MIVRGGQNKVELRDHIRETLRLVEEQTGLLETTPPADRSGLYAAAGLMHCCTLLRGMRTLEDASLGTVVGILERQHCEVWLRCLYTLLGGDEALSEFEGRYVQHTRDLTKTETLNLGTTYDPSGKGPSERLSLYKIAKRLGPLLAKAGETGDVNAPKKAYDVIYRVQSELATHAGVATVAPYIRDRGSSWSVEPNPSAPFNNITLTSALYTLFFAKQVFTRFGIATAAVEAAMGKLDQYLRAQGDTRST